MKMVLIPMSFWGLTVKDYRGKVVLLYFWATLCGPCIGNMPIVKKVYDANRDFGFDVIGINRDTEESDMSEYLNVCSLPWRQIFDGKEGPLKKNCAVLVVCHLSG